MIRNFVIYKAWDYGIYHQTQTSVIVRNTVIADSTVRFMRFVLFGDVDKFHERFLRSFWNSRSGQNVAAYN